VNFWVGTTRLGVLGLAAAVLALAVAFVVGLPSNRLRSGCGFGLRLLRLCRHPGGGHFRLLGHFRGQLRRHIWISGRSCGGLNDTPLR